MMTINQTQKTVHEIAKEHGFWSNLNVPEKLMLMVSELAEALEEYRNGYPITQIRVIDGKPEGVPVELADCVIRILDFCEFFKIDLEDALARKIQYNRTRPFRHGDKLA